MDHSHHHAVMETTHEGHEGHDMDDACAHAGHGHAMVILTGVFEVGARTNLGPRYTLAPTSNTPFHASVCQEILFTGWMTTNALELFGSAVAIFFAGVLYEGLKYFREALHARASATTGDSRVNITKSECGNNGPCGGTAVVKYTILSSGHAIQTLLHFLQSTASYTLMLVFMTYNVWLCLALVLGLAVGYFFFGWRKNNVVDINEHCQ